MCFGVKVIEVVDGGKWGMMVLLCGIDIVFVLFVDVVVEFKFFDDDLYDIVEVFFG